MNESQFEALAESLQKNMANEIAYTYSVFIPKSAKNVTSKMKRNIILSDRKFLDTDLQKEVGRSLIFPSDVLKTNLEKHINFFYSEFNLSYETLQKLLHYGSRADVFKKQFSESLDRSKEATLKAILHQLDLQIMQGKDAKSVISHTQNTLSKRMTYLNQLLKENAGQLEQYMVLWDYEDKGFSRYRLRTNGDTCESCTDLDGMVFPISEAECGKNLMPLHPNCDCFAEIIDEQGNVVFTIQRKSNDEDEKSSKGLEYLQASIRQIVLGNFTDDVNLLGTLGQIALGVLGVDIPADIRDLAYDIIHFEPTPEYALQTLLDVAALLPVVGGIKYIDEAGTVLKTTAKHGDEAADTVKKYITVTDFSNFPKKIHIGKQGKHILQHNNYIEGKSILNISIEEAQTLVNKYSGKGQKIGSNKERIDFNKVIGKYVDPKTGESYDTTIGTIHYSNSGTHIVPEKPTIRRR